MSKKESQWIAGNRAAYRAMLTECLRNLGHDKGAAAVAELEAVRVQLREAVEILGLEFDEGDHLGETLQRVVDQIREDY